MPFKIFIFFSNRAGVHKSVSPPSTHINVCNLLSFCRSFLLLFHSYIAANFFISNVPFAHRPVEVEAANASERGMTRRRRASDDGKKRYVIICVFYFAIKVYEIFIKFQ
jgi:hypothetical protein